MSSPINPGPHCPVESLSEAPRIELRHGTGGRRSRDLIERIFAKAFRRTHPGHDVLVDGTAHDSALLAPCCGPWSITTDSYVVSPLFFPGGNIGTLAVCGTLNDLAVAGAAGHTLTASFIIEEGMLEAELAAVATTMTDVATMAGVAIVAGDTKVVERGRGHGVFITTTAVGSSRVDVPWEPNRIQEGDSVIVSGDLGRHGMTIMAVRAGFEFETQAEPLESDVALLWPQIAALLPQQAVIACARDITRGGLGSVIAELSEQSGLGVELQESELPVGAAVRDACELLGFDPLYVACEGRFVVVVRPGSALGVAEALTRAGAKPRVVGVFTRAGERPTVRSVYGTLRPLDPAGPDQLPRIC